MNASKIGFLVELDYCVGCYACQSACNLHWGLPVGSSYMKVVKREPEDIDGKLVLFSAPIPYKLEKCAECIENADDATAPCTQICMGKALKIGDVEAIRKVAESVDGPYVLFA